MGIGKSCRGKPVKKLRSGLGRGKFRQHFMQLLKLALLEDIGSGDITSRVTVPDDVMASGRFVAKQSGTLAGLFLLPEIFKAVGSARVKTIAAEGQRVKPGDLLARVCGPARDVLTGERIALNFLSHLSGVATMTARFVEAVSGTQARIYDTRKTTPGMRLLEKYAVLAGGGCNHRTGLYDAVLIKDNHIAMLKSSPAQAVLQARRGTKKPIEVEVIDIKGLRAAISAGADIVMLDNFSPKRVAVAVGEARKQIKNQGLKPNLEIEVSGGITLKTVRAFAQAGPDRISVGALTHSAPGLDISLQFDPV
jgi:nicotinate-nucleotide pyrophosphorylase (carboxylating)